ncbi:MAG: 3-deoxy-D-manno-octulosonic acid transferase [Rhodobacteraceae bacterium]|nr:3-deoxy-D-manno-octulosonic acid transferase [Paracoccaceae bacterium]
MSQPGGVTPLYKAYSVLTRLAAPLVLQHVGRKLDRHGVTPERIGERAGHATLPRPDGPLIWFHGASVGESLSVLTVISRLGERLPKAHFLMTSGTASSAEIVSRRLPPRTVHQFAPLDAPQIIDRFLDHWQPQAGVFVESELWPGMLIRARDRGVALALLNARLSEKSARGWARYQDTSALLLGCFQVMLTQNADIAERLRRMGADEDRLEIGANLKATAAPLPVDAITREEFGRAVRGRPVWAASSTHPGEEEIVLQAHQAVLARHPDALLLLIPRHPERGDGVQAMIADQGLTGARRSLGEKIGPATQVYLADTLGETGTWYAVAPIVLLGGSLLPDIGGHNPFEPAGSGTAVLTGPHVANFSETFGPMVDSGAATETGSARDLADAVLRWLDDPAALDAARLSARRFAEGQSAALDQVIDRLIAVLGL